MNYLWDTNTAIYYLQGTFTTAAERFIDNILKDNAPIMSVITEMELLCWNTDNEKDMEVLQSFIHDALVVELVPNIKSLAINIRRTTGIKLPDAIIAATALEYRLVLVTRNVKDFTGIEGLKVENPFDKT